MLEMGRRDFRYIYEGALAFLKAEYRLLASL
jgi:hypothetical protein